jgi:hypothetical protein
MPFSSVRILRVFVYSSKEKGFQDVFEPLCLNRTIQKQLHYGMDVGFFSGAQTVALPMHVVVPLW